MFASGEYIVHGYNGLCLVKEVTCLNMSRIKKDALYYILCPLNSEDSKIYLPVENCKEVSRRIMTREEAVRFIDTIPEVEELWTPNHKTREELYKKSMRSCKCEEWIRIIKALCVRQTERAAMKKRLSTSDERFLKQAEEYLYGELSLAMGKSRSEIQKTVLERVNTKTIDPANL